jgi:putative acetyltransferase
MTSGADPAAEGVCFVIREETPDDVEPIDEVTRAAFRDHPFSRQTEQLTIRGLRDAGSLSLSLVATLEGGVIGHVAFSPVSIQALNSAWCGLGPVSVLPAHQRRGIGSALIRSGLRRLRERGVSGCVVVGDPATYCRFGFAPCDGLVYPGPPASHFLALALQGPVPIGEVTYHPAFSLCAP